MWTDDWIGLPYAKGGRGPEYDCVGLVLALYKARHGIDLPEPEARLIGDDIDADARGWERVEDVCEGDVLVFHGTGRLHVGYALDGADMLHITEHGSSRVERWKRQAWTSRMIGAFR